MFKKKILCLATVAALAIMNTVAVFGADSPSTNTDDSFTNAKVVADETTSTVKDGSTTIQLGSGVEGTVTVYDENGKKISDGVTIHFKNISDADYAELKAAAKADAADILSQMDIYVTSNATGAVISVSSLTLSITFTDANAKASDTYTIYHKKSTGDIEVINPTTSINGTKVTLTFTMTSTSPIIVVKNSSASNTTTNKTTTTTGTNTSTTSPKTGETATAIIVGLLALVGAAFCVRKLAVR